LPSTVTSKKTSGFAIVVNVLREVVRTILKNLEVCKKHMPTIIAENTGKIFS